jgi:hypothetical protein
MMPTATGRSGTKAAAGEKQLGDLYESHGASLRTATQLTSGGMYGSELHKKIFVDLYPFLPAHFEILLQLLAECGDSWARRQRRRARR